MPFQIYNLKRSSIALHLRHLRSNAWHLVSSSRNVQHIKMTLKKLIIIINKNINRSLDNIFGPQLLHPHLVGLVLLGTSSRNLDYSFYDLVAVSYCFVYQLLAVTTPVKLKLVSVGFVQHVPRINGEIPSVDEEISDHQRLLDRQSPSFPCYSVYVMTFHLMCPPVSSPGLCTNMQSFALFGVIFLYWLI